MGTKSPKVTEASVFTTEANECIEMSADLPASNKKF